VKPLLNECHQSKRFLFHWQQDQSLHCQDFHFSLEKKVSLAMSIHCFLIAEIEEHERKIPLFQESGTTFQYILVLQRLQCEVWLDCHRWSETAIKLAIWKCCFIPSNFLPKNHFYNPFFWFSLLFFIPFIFFLYPAHDNTIGLTVVGLLVVIRNEPFPSLVIFSSIWTPDLVIIPSKLSIG